MKQVYERLSGQSMIDEMREQTVKKICAYCEEHPNASKEELSTYVQAQIAEFALKADGIVTTDWIDLPDADKILRDRLRFWALSDAVMEGGMGQILNE